MALLNEKFASKILSKLAAEHGGIEQFINGGMRDGAKAWYGGDSIDLASVTDEMLTGEPFKYDDNITNDQFNNAILFNDGTAIALKPYRLNMLSNSPEPNKPKVKPSKYGSGIGDTGDHDKRVSPFDIDGFGKKQRQIYNGFGVSSDAGYAQSLRGAYGNNKKSMEYHLKKAEEFEKKYRELGAQGNHTEALYYKRRAQEYRDYAKRSESDMKNNLKNAKDVVAKHNRATNVRPITLNESEFNWVVKESVRRILEVKTLSGMDVEQSTFNMQLTNGNTYKYRVYVAKDDESAEITTDIFIYAPIVNGWEPEASYVINIEEYADGTWLPYWETLNGDCSSKRLRAMWQKISPLWVKLGYKIQEDNEIPF